MPRRICFFLSFGRYSKARAALRWIWSPEENSVAAVEDAAAWETTMNSNDFPSALNFILFLSSVNWIDVFNGMRV